MANMFFDVFVDLKLSDELSGIFEEVVVTKVTTTSSKDFIRVYIESSRLIEKKYVFAMEEAIVKQLFRNRNIRVKIYEKFFLSNQYTPENLLGLYKESLELELKGYNHMEYLMFKDSVCDFSTPGIMEFTVEATTVTKEKVEDLENILYKVFRNRCNMDVQIRMNVIVKEVLYKDTDDYILDKKISQIIEHTSLTVGERKKRRQETQGELRLKPQRRRKKRKQRL